MAETNLLWIQIKENLGARLHFGEVLKVTEMYIKHIWKCHALNLQETRMCSHTKSSKHINTRGITMSYPLQEKKNHLLQAVQVF